MFAGVDQSILRSTRNPLLNQEESRWTTSRSSAASSLWPFISRANPPASPPDRWCRLVSGLAGANSSCRRGSEAKCRSLASSSPARARHFPARAQLLRSGPKSRANVLKTQAVHFVEMLITIQNLASDRGTGRFARPDSSASHSSSQLAPVRLRSDEPTRRSSVRPRSEISVRRSEKKRCCSCRAIRSEAIRTYTGFRAIPITIRAREGVSLCELPKRHNDAKRSARFAG